MADFIHGYATLDHLVHDAAAVVRAVPVDQDVVQTAPGIGRANTTPARRTTFRLAALLRGSPVPPTFTVLEQVCPNIDVQSGDEWLLFLRGWDAAQTSPNATFVTLNGAQGQLRAVRGRVAGPHYDNAHVSRWYDGVAIEDVVADIRSAASFSADSAATYARAHGWQVERVLEPSDLYLRAQTNASVDDDQSAMLEAAGAAGLSLEPYRGRFLVVTSAQVRDPTGRGLDVYVAAALFDGEIVGVWGWAWKGETSCGVFSIQSVRPLQVRECG